MKDGYLDFFNYFEISDDEFIEYGLNSTIVADKEKTFSSWNILKNNIVSNKEVFIRGYGRDSKGTDLYLELYRDIFRNENIKKDPTNNSKPTKIIQELTGIKKNKDIINYQVSHVFGKTKNPYLFTAAWNIIYIPKIFDPFTGHESKGKLKEKFIKKLQEKIYSEYGELIEDYNEIISKLDIVKNLENIRNKLNINTDVFLQLRKDCLSEFEQINI